MNGRRAMFAGTFDPPTLGHLDIIKRAASIFEKLYIVIAVNPDKTCLFTPGERQDMLYALTENMENIEVCIWNGYSVDFALEHDVGVMVRGIRSVDDFEYEYEMACTNRKLYSGAETILIPADPELCGLSSSRVKEMALGGEDISKYVPESVRLILTEKFNVLT